MNTLPLEKRYSPEDDAELLDFDYDFCDKCQKETELCGIRREALSFATDSINYPEEWTYDKDGIRTCTSFKKE